MAIVNTSQWISSKTNDVLGFKQIKYQLMWNSFTKTWDFSFMKTELKFFYTTNVRSDLMTRA